MILGGCPGSKQIKEPVPEIHNCHICGADVEIWTHEMSRTCDKCGNIVTKDTLPSCIEWCEYAVDCVGPDVMKRFLEKKKKEEEEKSSEAESSDSSPEPQTTNPDKSNEE